MLLPSFNTGSKTLEQLNYLPTLLVKAAGWPEAFLIHQDSLGLAEGRKSVSDKMVLLQHLGDGLENRMLGLSRTGDRIPGKGKRCNGKN